MIVSHSKKFIFFHNPKAGGSSLRKVFAKYAEDDRFRYHGFVGGRFYPLSHLPGEIALEVLVSMFGDVILDYKRVMLVRDPVSRFVSAASEFDLKYGDWYRKFNMPLKEFLMQMLTPEALDLPQFSWFRNQSDFLPYSSSRDLNRVVPVEALDAAWSSTLSWLGLDFEPIPVENSGALRPGRLETSDPDIRSRVKMLHGSDFNWIERVTREYGFGYEFPVETTAMFDSYLWGIRNVKRIQRGELGLERSQGKLTPQLMQAISTKLLDL